jgi:HAD superfamily hydrolase (TIGR01549 family)
MFQHFIWDFDGTLFDSYPHMASSFQQALSALGVQESIDDIMPRIKISVGVCMEYYKNKYKLDDQLRELYKKFEEKGNSDTVIPFSYLKEALEKIISAGGKNYIYTHRNTSALEYIRDHSLEGLFADAITQEDRYPNKPAPDALLYLIEKHNLDKSKTIMVGDRDIDIQAAWNAGIAGCLFDPDNYYPHFKADFHINSMEEIVKLLG